MHNAVIRDFPTELINKVEPQLYKRLLEMYEMLYSLQQQQSQAPAQTQAAVRQQLQLIGLLGPLGQSLVGATSTPDPLLQNVGTGSGTVISVSTNASLSGGPITGSGTLSLVIGSNDTVQKSDGTKLVDSQIKDDGTVHVDLVSGLNLDSGTRLSQLGDWLGNGNLSKLEVDDLNQWILFTTLLGLYIFQNLPVVDPGITGAIWNNGGVINVSP